MHPIYVSYIHIYILLIPKHPLSSSPSLFKLLFPSLCHIYAPIFDVISMFDCRLGFAIIPWTNPMHLRLHIAALHCPL